MKLTSIFLFFLSAALAASEYPRMKFRGPPFPKPPPYQQIPKKWQQRAPPPVRARPPVRGPSPARPIPLHMPNHHKVQMGVAASVNRPVAVPVRNFWMNTQTTYRVPTVEQHYVTSAPVLPKKVFQSSPAILAQEYDFQVQSNNIPTPIKTIKQIGEKGPIHTIPAPNLSLADKPAVVEEVKSKGHKPFMVEEVKHRQPEVATFVQIQKSHQYQVTESPELLKQTFIKNYYETPSLQPNELYHLLNYQPVAVPETQEYLQLPQQNYVEEQQFAMDKSGNEDPKSSLVTAAYNLEPESSESVVQGYFERVEPEAKPEKNGTLEGFYVSLPNKEAADSLANLQAAGKLNSNLMQRTKEPVSIYVPEEESGQTEETYDDYSQEDMITEEMRRGGGEEFGHRVKPKQ